MSEYPSLTLQSHIVLQSSCDSFVQPAEPAHWFGSLVNRARQFIFDPNFLQNKNTIDENKGPIVCSAWHPTQVDQIAFGMTDGIVQVVVKPSSKPVLLRNQHQRDIRCLAWQPNSFNTLSVGCSTGILVWEVISQKTSSLPSRTTFHATAGAVTSLSYTPDGRQCLATAGNELLIYNCVTGKDVTCIKRVSSPAFVLTSPSHSFTFLAEGLRFHVLRGITEGLESFTRLQSAVRCAVWSPGSGSHLLISLSDSPFVLFLEVYSPHEINSKVSAQTDVLIDLHKTMSYKEGEQWCIEGMTIDDSGQRLGVLARDTNTSSSKVFIFGLSLESKSVYELNVLAEGSNPNNILYQHNTKQGTLLCICCENGDVNFIPDSTLTRS